MPFKIRPLNDWKRTHLPTFRKDGALKTDDIIAFTPRTEEPKAIVVRSDRSNVDDVRALLAGAPEADVVKAMDEIVADDIVAMYRMSSGRVDRPGDDIVQQGWKLSEFKTNPVMLFAHNSFDFPIGKGLTTFVDPVADALRGGFKFTPESVNPDGAKAGRLVSHGFMPAGSVGFKADKFEVAEDRVDPDNWMHEWMPPLSFKEQTLLEFSAVPIPANPDALVEGKGINPADLRWLREWAAQTLEASGSLVVPRHMLQKLAKAGQPVRFVFDAGRAVVKADVAEDTAVKCPGCDWSGSAGALGSDSTTSVKCPDCGHEASLGAFVDAAASKAAPVETPKADDPAPPPIAPEPQKADHLTNSELLEEVKRRGLLADNSPKVVQDESWEPAQLADFVGRTVAKEVAKAFTTHHTGRLPTR